MNLLKRKRCYKSLRKALMILDYEEFTEDQADFLYTLVKKGGNLGMFKMLAHKKLTIEQMQRLKDDLLEIKI